jgi:hypothetical protein
VRRAALPQLVLLVATVAAAALSAGCDRHPFVPVKSVAEIERDERVVIGLVRYADGDVSQWVKGTFGSSWPWFTEDFEVLQGPGPRTGAPVLGRDGGVFAVRVNAGPAYLVSIAVSARELLTVGTWSFPVMLKLPPTSDRCTFIGTVVLTISGPPPEGLPWYAYPGYETSNGARTKVTVVDTFDRDRAALSRYVEGCDLKKALATAPPPGEIEPLLRAAAQRSAEVRGRPGD